MPQPRLDSVAVFAVLAGLACAAFPPPAAAGQPGEFVPVTDEMLRDPDPADWLMAYRTYDFQAFSPLDEIDRDNVGGLRLAWMRAMEEGAQENPAAGLRRRDVHRPAGLRPPAGARRHDR